jgi:hypothetical protein
VDQDHVRRERRQRCRAVYAHRVRSATTICKQRRDCGQCSLLSSLTHLMRVEHMTPMRTTRAVRLVHRARPPCIAPSCLRAMFTPSSSCLQTHTTPGTHARVFLFRLSSTTGFPLPRQSLTLRFLLSARSNQTSLYRSKSNVKQQVNNIKQQVNNIEQQNQLQKPETKTLHKLRVVVIIVLYFFRSCTGHSCLFVCFDLKRTS